MNSMAIFRDEFVKISQAQSSSEESRKTQGFITKEDLKQLAKNVVAGATGSALGYGAGQLALMQLNKLKGTKVFKHPAARFALSTLLPSITGSASIALYDKLQREKQRAMDEAYIKGQNRGG